MQDPRFSAFYDRAQVVHACLCVRARVQHTDNVRLVTHVCRCDRHERWSRWLRHGRFRLVVRSSLSVRIFSFWIRSLFSSSPVFPFHLLLRALTLSRLRIYRVLTYSRIFGGLIVNTEIKDKKTFVVQKFRSRLFCVCERFNVTRRFFYFDILRFISI